MAIRALSRRIAAQRSFAQSRKPAESIDIGQRCGTATRLHNCVSLILWMPLCGWLRRISAVAISPEQASPSR